MINLASSFFDNVCVIIMINYDKEENYMSIYGIIFFVVTSLVFLIWYGGKSKPLLEKEIDELVGKLKGKHSVTEESKIIKELRTLCESDDGKSFYMVNLMKFNTKYNEDLQMTPMEAHKKYSKGIVKELLKRAGHPVMMTKVTGSFITESDSEWDDIGIIRYRSRRDMLKMIINFSDPELNKYKWAALKKTDVIPTKLAMHLPFVRIIVLSILLGIGFLL